MMDWKTISEIFQQFGLADGSLILLAWFGYTTLNKIYAMRVKEKNVEIKRLTDELSSYHGVLNRITERMTEALLQRRKGS